MPTLCVVKSYRSYAIMTISRPHYHCIIFNSLSWH